jgi:hypothetical protein
VDAPIAKSSAYVGNIHDAFAQGLRQRIALGGESCLSLAPQGSTRGAQTEDGLGSSG